jgi:cytoskeletal protein RodZ
MKMRIVGLLIAVALIALGVWSISHRRDRHAPTPRPNVAIQDGKTVDFSSGQPVVKDDAKEKKAIADSVAAMDEATKNVTFAPTATATQPAAPSPAKK